MHGRLSPRQMITAWPRVPFPRVEWAEIALATHEARSPSMMRACEIRMRKVESHQAEHKGVGWIRTAMEVAWREARRRDDAPLGQQTRLFDGVLSVPIYY